VCVYVYCIAVFCAVCFFGGFFILVASFPSVFWHCLLGLLTCKTVSQITYTVLVEMLNTARSINQSIRTKTNEICLCLRATASEKTISETESLLGLLFCATDYARHLVNWIASHGRINDSSVRSVVSTHHQCLYTTRSAAYNQSRRSLMIIVVQSQHQPSAGSFTSSTH